MALVELRPIVPDSVIFDLRYATNDNIIERPLYVPEFEPQLEEVAAQGLVLAANHAESTEHRLVVWDVWRPIEIQPILRQVNSDDRYILEDSNHPKGLAADVTLAGKDGKYLDMGTDYDDFSERAHAKSKKINSLQIFNRRLLSTIMTQAGFRQWKYEWWHFDFILKTAALSVKNPRTVL